MRSGPIDAVGAVPAFFALESTACRTAVGRENRFSFVEAREDGQVLRVCSTTPASQPISRWFDHSIDAVADAVLGHRPVGERFGLPSAGFATLP